jgi:hypothetical protein
MGPFFHPYHFDFTQNYAAIHYRRCALKLIPKPAIKSAGHQCPDCHRFCSVFEAPAYLRNCPSNQEINATGCEEGTDTNDPISRSRRPTDGDYTCEVCPTPDILAYEAEDKQPRDMRVAWSENLYGERMFSTFAHS